MTRTLSRATRSATAFTTTDYRPTRATEADCFAPAGEADAGWGRVVDDLLAIRNLTDNWDGQGAIVPPAALVDGAITLAQDLRTRRLPPADFAVASVNGTVLFEWHDPIEYTEIEVVSPVEAECRTVRTAGDGILVSHLLRIR